MPQRMCHLLTSGRYLVRFGRETQQKQNSLFRAEVFSLFNFVAAAQNLMVFSINSPEVKLVNFNFYHIIVHFTFSTLH